MSNPNLTEQGVKYWLKETLKVNNAQKKKAFSFRINIYATVFFLAVFAFLIWNKKDRSLSDDEKRMKAAADRSFILSKLNQYAALRRNNGLITNLPLP